MTDVVVPFSGWGRGTWSQLSWGLDSITNDGAAGQVNSVTIVAEANVPTTGLEATGGVGEVTISANVDVTIGTGVEATGAVDEVTITGDSNFTVTGVSAEVIAPTGGSTFTADGNAQLSTAQVKFGSASLLLDGTDDFCNL